MSRKLEDLLPPVASRARKLIKEVREQLGIEILIYCTLRSFEEQDALYAVGRSKPGNRVTNARGGQSWHNFGMAFDFVPLNGKKADWNSPHWNAIGEIGESLGLKWGGRFTKLVDKPHFEFHPGLTLDEAKRRLKNGDPFYTEDDKEWCQ